MKTAEELLLPRYKCIAPIPFQPFPMYNVGDIYTDNGKTAILNQNGDAVCVVEWDKYPHLFQPLPWYAERELSDMPEYVRYSEYYLNHYHLDGEYKDKIFKVDKWAKGHYGIKATGKGIIHGYEINFLPATLAEYEAYNQQP